ncbi:hypothetical protein MEME101129_27810 [Methylobacterium mesophilicum]
MSDRRLASTVRSPAAIAEATPAITCRLSVVARRWAWTSLLSPPKSCVRVLVKSPSEAAASTSEISRKACSTAWAVPWIRPTSSRRPVSNGVARVARRALIAVTGFATVRTSTNPIATAITRLAAMPSRIICVVVSKAAFCASWRVRIRVFSTLTISATSARRPSMAALPAPAISVWRAASRVSGLAIPAMPFSATPSCQASACLRIVSSRSCWAGLSEVSALACRQAALKASQPFW